ncbi:MAG TPA: sporulation protein YunB [Haloplasmataceae bacterium]
MKRRKITVKKILLFFAIIIFLFLFLVKAYFRSPLLVYAKQKAHLYASILINDAISTEIVPKIDTSNIISFEKKNNGYVTSVIVDVKQINMLISDMTKDIQKKLLTFQNDKHHELNNMKIPLGTIFDNPMLNNLGPNININMRMIGSVHTDISSTAKPFGINNSLIEVSIVTKVKFQVAIPFQKDEIVVENYTPLLIKVIQGSVPHYYYIGGSGYVVNPPPNSNVDPNNDLLEP